MTTLSLRYAPGHKAFTVQDQARTILARIPQDQRKAYVNVQGVTYAVTPADYVKALSFRPVTLSVQMGTVEVAKAEVKRVSRKGKSKLAGLWDYAKTLFGFYRPARAI